MTDETQKLRRFKDAVYTEAEGRVNSILAEAGKSKRDILEKAEQSVNSYKSAELARIDKEEEQRLVREISAARLEAQRKVLLHREKLADKVFENVAKKLEEYRSGEAYGSWLTNAAKSVKESYPDESATAFISPKDEKYAAEIEKCSGFDVQLKPTILLGGITICLNDRNIVLDSTFDTAVEDERQRFCRNSDFAAAQEQ